MSEYEELYNPWAVYLLPCGRQMRVRHILTDVKENGTDAEGQPSYELKFSCLVMIDPPANEEKALFSSQFGENDDEIKRFLDKQGAIKKSDLQ